MFVKKDKRDAVITSDGCVKRAWEMYDQFLRVVLTGDRPIGTGREAKKKEFVEYLEVEVAFLYLEMTGYARFASTRASHFSANTYNVYVMYYIYHIYVYIYIYINIYIY